MIVGRVDKNNKSSKKRFKPDPNFRNRNKKPYYQKG